VGGGANSPLGRPPMGLIPAEIVIFEKKITSKKNNGNPLRFLKESKEYMLLAFIRYRIPSTIC